MSKKCNLFFLIIISILFFYTKKEELLVPEEESLLKYYNTINFNILNACDTLSAIESINEADEAVYKLTELLTTIVDASDLVKHRSINTKDFPEYIKRLIKMEDEIYNNRVHKKMIDEYERLHHKNYCGSLSLAYLLNHYFLIKTNTSFLFAPYYSTRYRLLLNTKNDETPPTSNFLLAYQAFFYEKLRLQYDNDFTLIMLDAFSISRYRGFYINERLLSPMFPTLRGERSPFENCLCPLYCFTTNLQPNKKTVNFLNVTDFSPQYICSLKKTEACQLPIFLKEYQREYSTALIFSLPKSFKSPFLIVLYNKDELYPYAFYLRENLYEYESTRHHPTSEDICLYE